MHRDRIFGICVLLFGALLLFVLIPNEVAEGRGYTDPGRFPRIAAGLFILLGGLHAIFSKPGIDWPTPREAVRIGLVFLAAIAAIILMPRISYVAGAVIFMACLTALMYEKRAHWVAVTTLAVPFGLYAFFVLLLHRSLPQATLF